MSATVNTGTVVPGFVDAHTWSACFGLSIRELYLVDAMGSRRIIRPNGKEIRKVAGAMGISEARNQIAKSFLDETDGEWLWFIDTDMGFGPDTVDQLIASADPTARPVVGGLCFALRRTDPGPFHSEIFGVIPTLYQWLDMGDEQGFSPIQWYPMESLIEVGATGAACVLIHRSALETVRMKHGDTWFDLIVHPTAGKNGKPRTFSEDLSFCVRLAQSGIRVHVNTSVKTVHHKGGLFLSEDLYIEQEARAAQAKKDGP